MGFSPANLLFFLWATSATVSGVVVDETGQPVVDAEVRLSPNPAYLAPVWEGEAGTVRVRTSAEGTFRLERVASGRLFDLAVTRPGFAPSLRALAVPKERPLPPLRIILRRGRTVSGSVVDRAGRPAAGAQMELARSEAGAEQNFGISPSDRGLHQAATGPDGRFTIPDLPAGRFNLDALGPGFRLRLAEAVAVTPGAEPLHLGTFTLERGALEGRVRDAEGRPVAEAKVWVRPEGWEDEWWSTDFSAEEPAAVTGPDGRFEIPGLLAQGWNGLVVCRKGFAAAVADSPELREPVEVVLSPAVPLSGRVVGSRGEPVTGASVWAPSSDPWLALTVPKGPCPPEPSSSDAEGRFTLELATPGWYQVAAEADGFLSVRRERVGVPSDEDLALILETGATVEGRVLDPAGEPIPRAVVGIYDGRGGAVSVSGPDGSYRLPGVEPGPRSLKAEHGDYSEETREIEVPAEGRQIDIVLERQPSHEIRGRVLGPDGEPVEGAQVRTAAGLWAATEADGSFLLRTTEPDDPWLRAEKEGYGAGRIELPPPPVSGLEVRLAHSVSLTGKLLGLAPEELAEATVSVFLGEGLPVRQGIVDSEGRYRILDLAPGEWMVNAQAGVLLSVFESVTVPPDVPEVAHDLTFPPTFEVRGRVTSQDREPLADAEVSFELDSLAIPVVQMTERDGTFLIRLKEGEYAMTASLPGYFGGESPRIVRVAGAPVDGVDFELRRGAVLTGRILEFEPDQGEVTIMASHPEGALLSATVDPDGIYRIPGMSPGTWQIRALSGSFLNPRKMGEGQVHLLPGETEAVLDIVLHGFGVPEEP